ncbi:hypothetical protein FQZ97_1038300 [compost metagenome]
MLDGATGQGVGLLQAPILPCDELGHEKQTDSLHSSRRVRLARQHEVDDVLRQILFATTDEDLAAADLVATVGLRLGAGAQQGKVRAGLGLGQAHGAGPLTTDHPGQITVLELRASVPFQCQDRTLGKAGIDAEGQ